MSAITDRIESLLSARLFLSPRVALGRIYFISDLSGRLSLYVMDARPGGSVPEPLLPPSVSLQNPHLLDSLPFHVFPALDRILVIIDRDGDENYQPMFVPVTGGSPEPAFGEQLAQYRVRLMKADPARSVVYLAAESRDERVGRCYRGYLATGELDLLGESVWGPAPMAYSPDHSRAILAETMTFGDVVLHEWRAGRAGLRLVLGKPLASRAEAEAVPLTGVIGAEYISGTDSGLLLATALHDDRYGLGYLPLSDPVPEGQVVEPVAIDGIPHSGEGELTALEHLEGRRFLLTYNIDGCSYLYEGLLDVEMRRFTIDRVLCGIGDLTSGVLQSATYDIASRSHALSFSTAVSPPQVLILSRDGDGDEGLSLPITRERVQGLDPEWLAPGEDASFTSFDGLRVSARLYLPSPALGLTEPRPLVYYIHGGPQGQERPDFTWFSMPLIQLLTLGGLAVFVPNVRGSEGYGLDYMKRVDRDWGGKDRQDHVHAMTQVLARDRRLDMRRAGVIGRSYGGYMTLTLAGRHPELWSAAVDMFGPYDLLSFMQRIPEAWKPYFEIAVGNRERDRDFLIERSPATYIDHIACPLLVIQGRNDPRVIEQESRDVVERLRAQGKMVDYLVFEDEGHDVLKYANKVRCYEAIAAFFSRHLGAEVAAARRSIVSSE